MVCCQLKSCILLHVYLTILVTWNHFYELLLFFFTSNPLCNHSHRNCAFIKLINPQPEKVLWKKKTKKQIVTVGLLKNNMYSNNLLKKNKTDT